MKRCLIVSLLLLLAGIWTPEISYAVCTSDEYSPEERKNFISEASASEEAGRFIEAIEGYYDAYLDCNNDDPLSLSAMEGAKRAGYKLGELQEKKGNLYTGGPENGIGAFEWFEASTNYADADRVMVKAAKKTEDIKAFTVFADHFRYRNHNMESLKLKSPGYIFDADNLKELGKEASKRGDAVLVKENEVFGKAQKSRNSGVYQESIELLQLADEWFRILEDPNEKKVFERAEIRGDALYANENHESLKFAIIYYALFHNEEKIERVKTKASMLGDACAKKTDYENAITYYGIADNYAKEKEMSALLEKQERENEDKEEQRQDKFKKDQVDLERELGL